MVPAGYVTVRAYAELNDFLAPESRGPTLRRPSRTHQPPEASSRGLPPSEVGLILAIGDARALATAHVRRSHRRIPNCSRRSTSTARLRPVPLRNPRFVVDVNLGRLARLLRLLGFDVWWSNDAEDQALVDVSLAQQRIR